MDDIQSWWEVPSIAHFCSLFRAAFNLLDFDIEELENALLTDGIEDAGSSLLQELIVKLLTGCLNNNGISTSNYQMFLRRLFRQKCKEYGRENPFDNDMDFQFLSLRIKVEILHSLCDFRLDAEDVMDLLKNLDSDSLRVYPLGRDKNKSVYWYFYGTRLYREDHNKKKEAEKKGEKRGRGRKKGKEKGKADKFEANEIGTGEWNVVCYSESDWERLVHDTEDSGDKEEELLHQILAKDFLPEIPRLFEEKERLQRKRLLEMQPRRQSSRIEKLKHQKEVEKQIEMERRKEEIERRKEESERRKLEGDSAPPISEEDEIKRREQIRKDRERRKQERDMRREKWQTSDSSDWRSSSDEESEKQYERLSLTDEKGKPKGRQTNNSLSSATGQIIIQSQPVRQKLRTSQVFPTSFEDIKIGLYKIIEKIKNHADAWPFLYPVESEDAPRYYKVIKEPMDLQTMEDKLDGREYFSTAEFKRDFQLIVENCKKFNGPSSEYSGMVVNLEKEFNALVGKYLAELSSDEEVALEFPDENLKHKKKHHKSSNHHRSSSWSKKNRHDEYLDDKENEDRSSTPPESSYVTKSARSVRSVSSSVDEKVEDSQDEELEDTRSSDSRTRRKSTHTKKSVDKERSSQKKPKNTVKSAAAIEALELATEQTLKDINKWLDDTPKFSDYSCDNSSPAHHLGVVDDIEVQNRIESEYRRSLLEKPPRLQKESLKRRHLKDPQNVIKKKREIQRKIDRLQPGKSKGNLLSTNKQPPDETSVSGSNSKESMKVDETDSNAPKLSLGTVLLSDDIGLGSLGSKKLSFGDSPSSDTKYSDDEKYEISSKVKEPKVDYLDNEIIDKSDSKPVETVKMEEKKEEEDAEEKPDMKATSNVPDKSCTKAESASTKEKPNLSAWFKAFGAPKTAAAPKRKSDFASGNPPTPSPLVDFKDSSNDLQPYSKYRYLDDKPLDSPNDLPPMTPGRSLSPDDKDRKNVYNSPEVRPGTRKRKASTGSSVSERSSFSQDPTDPMLSPHPTLSPHPSLDEPYLSPQQDVLKSFHHSPVNGTIKVGFYQDTFPRGGSDKSNSCSPREQLPSNSPRNMGLSPKNSQLDSPDYHKYSAPSTPVYQAPASPAPTYNSPLPFYPGHPSSILQNVPYYDVNKSVTEQYNTPPVAPTVSKPPVSTPPTVSEKPVSVYPVKKRAYCEIEPEQQQQQQSVIKPVIEKASSFTPLASVRDPERVFTPTPGRMPQSTERAIGLHHRYPNELIQSSPYYANENIYSKNVGPPSSVPPTSSYSKAEEIATTASYGRNVETTNVSDSYPAYNRLSTPVYNYPNPVTAVNRMNARPEKQVPLNYSNPPSSTEMLSSRSTPSVNYSNVATSSPNLLSKSTAPPLNYLDRNNPELLNFSKLHPVSAASDPGRQPDLSSRLVENPSRSNPHISYPQNRASYTKVDLNPTQPSRVHYSNPITDLSSKINIPSGLGYPSNQGSPLGYSHPMGEMRYGYPAMMSEMPAMMAGKSSVNYPAHTPVGYSVDAYKHPMVDLVGVNKTQVSEPQAAAKTPKTVPPKKASSRKKKAAVEAEAARPHPEPNLNPISSSGYQQYSGQASAEPISLKTTNVVPGSAFNFGPAPLKDSYPSYLGDMSRSSYYLPHSGTGIPEAGSNEEKASTSSPHAAPSYPFPRAPYPHLTHHPPAIYQQYLQRHQQDLLRPMGLHGLLAPPTTYSPGYIMHDPLNRPPHWM